MRQAKKNCREIESLSKKTKLPVIQMSKLEVKRIIKGNKASNKIVEKPTNVWKMVKKGRQKASLRTNQEVKRW